MKGNILNRSEAMLLMLLFFCLYFVKQVWKFSPVNDKIDKNMICHQCFCSGAAADTQLPVKAVM